MTEICVERQKLLGRPWKECIYGNNVSPKVRICETLVVVKASVIVAFCYKHEDYNDMLTLPIECDYFDLTRCTDS